ncbi:hypothetical protein [Photorhabdus caribbeanensis]|nr:hypothetical protein [Photorhabdus caribbeanensis]
MKVICSKRHFSFSLPDEFNPANKWIPIDLPGARMLIDWLADGKITVEMR